MLNYVMYNLLSYLLGTPTALQLPHQANLTSPNIANDAQLPHVGGPPPQVGAGFLVALAAAGGAWWLLSRSTVGFEFRTVGANPSAARSAGMSVGRTWVLAMLLAGGLAGLAGAVVIQGTFYSLNFQSYGTYGIDRYHRRPARPGQAAGGRAGRAALRRPGRRQRGHAGRHVGVPSTSPRSSRA